MQISISADTSNGGLVWKRSSFASSAAGSKIKGWHFCSSTNSEDIVIKEAALNLSEVARRNWIARNAAFWGSLRRHSQTERKRGDSSNASLDFVEGAVKGGKRSHSGSA